MNEPADKRGLLCTPLFRGLRWLIALVAVAPLAMLASGLARNQMALDGPALLGLMAFSALPIAVFHIFRWAALAVLAFLPSLND